MNNLTNVSDCVYGGVKYLGKACPVSEFVEKNIVMKFTEYVAIAIIIVFIILIIKFFLNR